MEKMSLTKGAQAKLRAFLNSPEGTEFMAFLRALGPESQIKPSVANPVEIAALTGVQGTGYKKCCNNIEAISDPEYDKKKNLK